MSVIPQSQEYSMGENGYESLKEYAEDLDVVSKRYKKNI
jgi:predicted CoA-binding protein